MRKTIVIILSFCLLTLNAKAEELSTLLLHDGNYTQFMGSSSFKKAYDTAVEGDTIIFSPGNFTEGPGDVLPKIKKNNLHLIGSGAFDSALRTNLYTLEIEAEGVTVENVVSTLTVYGSHSRLIGCYLNVLTYTSNILYNGGKVPEDNVVSQCVIEKMMSVQSYNVQDLILKNCTIKEFFNSFLTNKNGKNMYLTNCVIYSAAWLPSANYTNNIIYAGGNPEFRTPSVFTDNLFYAETEPTLNFGGCTHTDDVVSTFQEVFGGEENYPATPINVPNGNDGKPVGIYGGEGFQENSPIPVAKSYNVSTVTTFLGNVSMAIKTTGTRMRFWWNDDESNMLEFPVDESGIITQDIEVPEEAKWTRGMARGVAKLHVAFVGPTGLMNPPIMQNVTFSKGVPLTLTLKNDNLVELRWDDKDFDLSLGAYLYYSKNGGPYLLWRSNLYYGTYESVYLSKGEYKFLVVMKESSGELSSTDEKWAEYIKIEN